MIRPRYFPPDSYIDDPAENLDHADAAESQRTLAYAMTREALTRICSWIAKAERKKVKQRALRLDAFLLNVFPCFLREDHPSAAWVARQHGISRQRFSLLQQEFVREVGPHLQFKGQRFLNQAKRRGRVRRGQPRSQPGPVAGAEDKVKKMEKL
jgi:hypothetical protein